MLKHGKVKERTKSIEILRESNKRESNASLGSTEAHAEVESRAAPPADQADPTAVPDLSGPLAKEWIELDLNLLDETSLCLPQHL